MKKESPPFPESTSQAEPRLPHYLMCHVHNTQAAGDRIVTQCTVGRGGQRRNSLRIVERKSQLASTKCGPLSWTDQIEKRKKVRRWTAEVSLCKWEIMFPLKKLREIDKHLTPSLWIKLI